MRGFGISSVLMGVVLTATLAYGQDPADQTPSAPPPRAAGAQGARQGRGGGGGPQATLPQMPGNGGDVNRDGIIASAHAFMEAMKSGNMADVAAMITDDAVFVDGNGISTKPEVMKSLAGVKVIDYTMSDVRFVPDSSDNGVVSYTLTETGTYNGKAYTAKNYVSSAWEGGGAGGGGGRRFLCVFHQATPAR